MKIKVCVDPHTNKPIKLCDRDENSSDPEKMLCCMCSNIEINYFGKLFKREHIEFIVLNHKEVPRAKLTEMLNEKFRTNFKAEQIKNFCSRHKLRNGLIGSRFEKGHVPHNKGKKGIHYSPATEFKKGHVPANTRPIGSESVTRDGYIVVKVANERAWNKAWKLKHKIIWEEANGPIPKGHILIFLDGDKTNCNLDNLMLVKRADLLRLNFMRFKKTDPTITKSAVMIAKLQNKIGERRRMHAEKQTDRS